MLWRLTPAGVPHAVVRPSGSPRLGSSPSRSTPSRGEQRADLSLVQDVPSLEVFLGAGHARLSIGIAQQLQGGLDGLEVLGSEEHHVVAPVPRGLDTLMRRRHLFGDLRQSRASISDSGDVVMDHDPGR